MQHTSVAEWLASIGLTQYADAFAANDIEADILGELSDQDLEKIGVTSLGHRRRLLRAAAALGERAEPVASVPLVPPAAILPTIDAPTAPRQSAGERRHLTVMFCDLVGSTALAARLDPEDMREVVRAYQSACASVIARYEGFVAQYLGDGVMAYFGYPAAHEDDAERAVRAGLDLVAAVTKLKTKLEVRVGIATGLVVVGDLIGEQGAKERAVTGETPNLAARLQGLAAPDSIVVSAATRRLLGGMFDLRDLGAQQVKGLDAPIQSFAVAGVRSFESRFEARAGGLTGFVGREEECENLVKQWKLARQARGQIVLVTGEAGIGKSRLTAWLVDKVAGEPHTRMRYQCTPHHKDSALYPTIAQIERAAGIEANGTGEAKLSKLEALLVPAGGEAAETVPLFAALLAIPTGDKYAPLAMSPGQQRQRTMAALLDQVEALARQKPLLMIYEDAHWADATSLELLDSLVDRIARLPVLFVVTGRPEFQPAWAGRHNVSTTTLQKLDRRDARVMVESVAGAALPAEVLDQIVQKTDGVPLFVEELTKTVLESGVLVEDRGGLTARTTFPIPATLQDSLMARLDRSNPVKEVAQVGAAIGREFSYQLLVAVAGMSEASVREGLAKLEEAELAACRGVPPDATYTFKHALVQDAAYESLLKSRRQVIHRRLAKALRDQFPVLAETEPEIVAHHFTQTGRSAQAIAWWTKAGDAAEQRYAFVEASGHFEKAVSLADQLPTDQSQLGSHVLLHLRHTLATLRGYGYSAVPTADACVRARALADEIGDGPERAAVYFYQWLVSFIGGDPLMRRRAAEIVERCSSVAIEDTTIAVFARSALGYNLWVEGNNADARDQLETLVTIADADPSLFHNPHNDSSPYQLLAYVVWALGDVERARSLVNKAVALASQSKYYPAIVYELAQQVEYEILRFDPVRMLPLAKAVVDLTHEHGQPLWRAAGLMAYGWARWRAGEPEAGEGDMQCAETMFGEQGVIQQKPWFSHLKADIEARSGRFDAALSMLDGQLADNHERQLRWLDSPLHRQRGHILLQCSPPLPHEAEAAFLYAIRIARSQQARSFELRASLDLARLYCDTGREFEAIPLLHTALVGFEPTPELPEIGEAQQLLLSIGGALPPTPVGALQ